MMSIQMKKSKSLHHLLLIWGAAQQVYDNYESNFDEEQHCVEINHPESVEDIEQPYFQFNLQVAESGSHYEEEYI